MGRPFYNFEAEDPDLDWLVSNFLYDRPNYVCALGADRMAPLILLPLPPSMCLATPGSATEDAERLKK